MSFNTPILFLTFTRFDSTKKVFEQIKKQQPKQVFWASDGPRADRPEDVEKIEKIKEYILAQIDWECNLQTLFREENLGCGLAVSEAITWFFANVEQGIILEDDCLPKPEFFSFCEDLLDRYKNNQRVFGITGTNLQRGVNRGDASYYFSNYGGIWGWASWRRAWNNYDFKMQNLNTFIDERRIEKIFDGRKQKDFWIKMMIESKKIDTWDYQWLFTNWFYGGLYIVPNVNLIYNIGFGGDSTHTNVEPHWYKSAIAGNEVLGNLRHPAKVEVNKKADDFLFNNSYLPISFSKRVYLYIKKRLFKS